MAGDTKKRIMDESLRLFSEKGYDSVSMTEIASAVGIKAPSIYKHYPSKKGILDAIVEETFARYEHFAGAYGLNGSDPVFDASIYGKMDEECLRNLALSTVRLFKEDRFLGSFRKMVSIDRYCNPEMSRLYKQLFIDTPLGYQSRLFSVLFPDRDPMMLAMRFFLPVIHLMELCDIGQLDDEMLYSYVSELTGSFYRDMAAGERSPYPAVQSNKNVGEDPHVKKGE